MHTPACTIRTCAFTLYTCVDINYTHVLYTCPHAYIARVCTHTYPLLLYTVKSSPTVCLAGGTGRENPSFGTSGLPALSGFPLPASALKQATESCHFPGCQIPVTSDPQRERDSSHLPSRRTVYPPLQPACGAGRQSGAWCPCCCTQGSFLGLPWGSGPGMLGLPGREPWAEPKVRMSLLSEGR